MSGDLERMDAGTELDRLVAEKVMGWKSDKGDPGILILPGNLIRTVEAGWDDRRLFQPSTNIGHAWEVVERLKSLNWFAEIGVGDKIVSCEMNWLDPNAEDESNDRMVAGEAEAAPLAICRAALAALAFMDGQDWAEDRRGEHDD